jgi:hypothetical protein
MQRQGDSTHRERSGWGQGKEGGAPAKPLREPHVHSDVVMAAHLVRSLRSFAATSMLSSMDWGAPHTEHSFTVAALMRVQLPQTHTVHSASILSGWQEGWTLGEAQQQRNDQPLPPYPPFPTHLALRNTLCSCEADGMRPTCKENVSVLRNSSATCAQWAAKSAPCATRHYSSPEVWCRRVKLYDMDFSSPKTLRCRSM